MITVANSENEVIEDFLSEDKVSFFIEDALDEAPLWSTVLLEMKPCYIIIGNISQVLGNREDIEQCNLEVVH